MQPRLPALLLHRLAHCRWSELTEHACSGAAAGHCGTAFGRLQHRRPEWRSAKRAAQECRITSGEIDEGRSRQVDLEIVPERVPPVTDCGPPGHDSQLRIVLE